MLVQDLGRGRRSSDCRLVLLESCLKGGDVVISQCGTCEDLSAVISTGLIISEELMTALIRSRNVLICTD